MSELRVEPLFGPDESAVVQLVDEQLSVVQKALTVDSGPARFDVDEGSYLMRALWSDGRRTQQVVEVASTGAAVQLDAPSDGPPAEISTLDPTAPEAIIESATRHSDLSADALWQPQSAPQRAGDTATTEAHDATREQIERALEVTGMVLQGPEAPTPSLWRRADSGTWEAQPLDADAETVPGGVDVRLSVGDALHLVEVRSGAARQYLALPAEQSIVSIRSFAAGSAFYTSTDVRTADDDVEALRGYIQNGELAVARTLAPEVMAERFLRSKVAAPRIAALGAYFLLRVGDLERLHNWPDNLTRWKTWLPDGPVIAAWQRLQADQPDYDEAYELLLEAARRGPPVYTEGVRLLKNGLDLFANDDEEEWAVADAVAEIDRYGKAMNWGKSETAFFGDAPHRPRLGARLSQRLLGYS